MRAAVAGVFGGVAEQVGEHLGQAHLVALDHQRLAAARPQLLAALADARLHGFERLVEHVRQHQRLQVQGDLAAADAGRIQQVVEQAWPCGRPGARSRATACAAGACVRRCVPAAIADMLIGTSGLRSSCASMARNSFWRRLAASASSAGAAPDRGQHQVFVGFAQIRRPRARLHPRARGCGAAGSPRAVRRAAPCTGARCCEAVVSSSSGSIASSSRIMLLSVPVPAARP
jgi:hypothetical protein